MTLRSYLIIFTFIIFPTITYAGFFGPSDYDECIREGLKDAKTNTAIYLLQKSCRNEFPEKEPEEKFVKCGNEQVNENESASINIKLPVEFGNIQPIKVQWEPQIAGIDIPPYFFNIYAQSNFSFPIQEIKITSQNKKDKSKSTYSCKGFADSNTVGKFTCSYFENNKNNDVYITEVVSAPIKIIDFDRIIGRCKTDQSGEAPSPPDVPLH